MIDGSRLLIGVLLALHKYIIFSLRMQYCAFSGMSLILIVGNKSLIVIFL